MFHHVRKQPIKHARQAEEDEHQGDGIDHKPAGKAEEFAAMQRSYGFEERYFAVGIIGGR